MDNTHFLAKWVDANIILKDPDGKLNPSAIEIKRIPGFSTNKIPSSKPSDLDIEIKEDYKVQFLSPWTEGAHGKCPSKEEFIIDNTRQHYFLMIGNINGLVGQYENPPGKEDKKYKFELQVSHRPLECNYWHFEFIVIANGVEITNANSGWKKLICSTVIDRIQEVSIFKI